MHQSETDVGQSNSLEALDSHWNGKLAKFNRSVCPM